MLFYNEQIIRCNMHTDLKIIIGIYEVKGESMSRILVVDDEQSIRDLVQLILQMENYEIITAKDGEEALKMIQEEEIDLILLDIMLPKINGLELISSIQQYEIPVIFLTAKISVQDKVMGLKLGAEDYITKPFEPLELLARVEVILRRKQKKKTLPVKNILNFHHLTIYKDERMVKINDKEVYLTIKEYDLLLKFIENPNTVFSREHLLVDIWGYDYLGGSRTVDMHVKQIRKKLDLQDYIQTVFKVGYKLKD